MNPDETDRDSASKSGASIVGKRDPHSRGPGPYVMAADTLQGDSVVDPNGDKLGTVAHIMLDVPTGRVAYAVLSFGSLLGMGGKLFAVPWSALTLDTQRKCFVVGTDKDKLKAAPGFNKDNWPSMADLQWATSLHQYYGASPYWDEN